MPPVPALTAEPLWSLAHQSSNIVLAGSGLEAHLGASVLLLLLSLRVERLAGLRLSAEKAVAADTAVAHLEELRQRAKVAEWNAKRTRGGGGALQGGAAGPDEDDTRRQRDASSQ